MKNSHSSSSPPFSGSRERPLTDSFVVSPWCWAAHQEPSGKTSLRLPSRPSAALGSAASGSGETGGDYKEQKRAHQRLKQKPRPPASLAGA